MQQRKQSHHNQRSRELQTCPWLCFSPEHKGFDGTISLSSNLITLLIKEVGVQLADMGFKRLILINAHGGQISLLNLNLAISQ